jgi:hypothetical protein
MGVLLPAVFSFVSGGEELVNDLCVFFCVCFSKAK